MTLLTKNVVLVSSLFTVATLLASTPPNLPSTLPPLVAIRIPAPPAAPALLPVAITRDVLKHSALSPTAYEVMLAGLRFAPPTGATNSTDESVDLSAQRSGVWWSPTGASALPAVDWRQFHAATNLTPNTFQVSNDTNEDREPSIMAIRKSDNTEFGAVGHLRMSTITFGADTFPLNTVKTYTTTNYQTFTAAPLPFNSPDWTRYEHQGDPAFAENPYSSG